MDVVVSHLVGLEAVVAAAVGARPLLLKLLGCCCCCYSSLQCDQSCGIVVSLDKLGGRKEGGRRIGGCRKEKED